LIQRIPELTWKRSRRKLMIPRIRMIETPPIFIIPPLKKPSGTTG
jgi:hypothetical protein